MAESIETLEQRIELLRTQVRQAAMGGDRERARILRRELREAEQAWDRALALEDGPSEPGARAPWGAGSPRAAGTRAGANRHDAPGPGRLPAGRPAAPETAPPGGPGAARPAGRLLPLREQVHQALTLLTVPAAPRLVSTVHEAFFAGAIPAARLTSLRRDEERSFRSAPFARPYYLCAALTADLLGPARGLLAVSTWMLECRVIGPLSPRVDYLTAAVAVAESIQRIQDAGPTAAAVRLLWRFAANIPGAAGGTRSPDPAVVARAARAERQVHAPDDASTRRSAAQRARRQLSDAEQLFGAGLRAGPQARTGS